MPSVTVAQLTAAAPSGDPKIIKAIADQSGAVFAKYGLTNRNRVLGFLSVALEETGGFKRLVENMNYSAERLLEMNKAIWPGRFPTLAIAAQYAHNPQKLANYVYGGRMGNTAPNEGWLRRGQGVIQQTGHNNQALVQKLTGLPILDHPEFLTDPAHLLECAVALFVHYPKILEHCDRAEWPAVWALVGSGRENGPIANLQNHTDALARMQKAIPALVDGPTVAQGGPVSPVPDPAPIPAPPDVPRPPVAPLPWWRRLFSHLGLWRAA